jgi:uncharacterized protein (DUF849 family)
MKDPDRLLLEAFSILSREIVENSPLPPKRIVREIARAALALAAVIDLHSMDEDEFVEMAREAFRFSCSETHRVKGPR